MSRQKVMEDLDALLADLQLTSAQPAGSGGIHCGISKSNNIPFTNATIGQPVSMSTSALVSSHDVVADDGQPIYETQSIRMSPYNVERDFRGGSSASTLPAAYTRNVKGEALQLDAARSAAALSSNLSELDSLLQELSSAQFAVEIDRRVTDRDINSSTRPLKNIKSDDSFQANSHIKPGNIKVASSATRELDDLMASLNSIDAAKQSVPADQRFTRLTDPIGSTDSTLYRPASVTPDTQLHEMHSVPAVAQTKDTSQMAVTHSSSEFKRPSAGSQSNAVNLNALMEDLDRNMTQYGVTTVPKGHCSACAKPIIGQVIMALGRLWHPEHFTCIQCKEPLGTRNFFERDAVPYCERDYHLLFSPQCASCEGPILDRCITALDKTWHPEHFCCLMCGCELGGEIGFHEHDGQPYCRDDFFEHFAPRCGGCGRPIVENFISALNRQWHPPCFVCTECLVPFGTGTFFEHNGMPYCETHFHAQRGSLCAGCHKPVTGRCITAMYRKYHIEHFVCTYCQRQLNKGTFKEQNDMPYCHPCFVRLFS